MARVLALLVCLVACAAGGVAAFSDSNAASLSLDLSHFQKPWFYHDLEGPEFKVLNKTDVYEERQLKSGKWASTQVSSILYSAAVSTGFKRLFAFITGANSANETMSMAIPVRVNVAPGEGPFCENSFKISFWIPKWKQDDVPEPNDARVFIEKQPSEVVYVKAFGGFALDPIVLLKARAFQDDLEKEGVPFEKEFFYTAGYDPPYRLTQRHNEIWFAKKDNSSSTADS